MPRTLLLALLVAPALALAGCTTGDGGATPTPTTPADGGGAATLPPPIEDSQQVTGSADPLNFASGVPCETPSSQCFRYPFTLNATAAIDATLTWTVPANDFDLYVFKDGAPFEQDGATPPGTEESVQAALDAGEYEVVVVAWGVSQDTFTLSATFAPA